MIDVALFPETTTAGPPWVCAEVRLLRPYRHPQMQRRLRCRVHYGDDSNLGPRVDAVVMQRGGPCDMRLDTLIALVDTAAKRRLPIIYDLDDDLLSRHSPCARSVAIWRRRAQGPLPVAGRHGGHRLDDAAG